MDAAGTGFLPGGNDIYCMANADDEFLQRLPVLREFGDVADIQNYEPLPHGWALAVADVINSTGAIDGGRYKAVNMAGAGVISALLNALERYDLPFVFGGDGAVVAVPPASIETARETLSLVLSWVRDDMDLAMRASIVPVEDIRHHGLDVRVARFNASNDISYAMFSGGGSSWAEARMKEGEYGIASAPKGARPDLSGLSCRWNPIAASYGRIVSIIVLPKPEGDMEAFRRLVSELVDLSNEDGRGGHPVPAAGPEVGFAEEGIRLEAKARSPYGFGWARVKHTFGISAQMVLVRVLASFNASLGRFSANGYRQGVARNTDFRKFEDGLKMTVDVDAARLAQIRQKLGDARAEGVCYFGLHEQDEALMTCIVPSAVRRNHMHFVDGAMGGYATAATYLKAQMGKA